MGGYIPDGDEVKKSRDVGRIIKFINIDDVFFMSVIIVEIL